MDQAIETWIMGAEEFGMTIPQPRAYVAARSLDIVKRDSENLLLFHCSKQEQQLDLAVHNRYDGQAALLIKRSV